MSNCHEKNCDMAEEDEKLAGKSLKGDKKSFEILVNRYSKPVMSLIYRMTGDYDGSLDLAQETFLKSWKYLKSYREGMKFSSWLFKIAVNLAKDYKVKYNRNLDCQESVEQGAYKEDPEGGLYIKSLLEKLEEPYKTAIILRFMNDLTYGEISEIMSVSPEQVKNYIFRGRKSLIKLAREEDFYEVSL
ncbi:MAG: sigma-70 family RNA polymerase sigma factor [Candidatus Eremiobacterota bacterium]